MLPAARGESGQPKGARHEATVHTRPASAVRPTYACIQTRQGSGATDADTTCCGIGASGRRCPRPKARRESARRQQPSRERASPRRGRRRLFPKHLVWAAQASLAHALVYVVQTRADARHPNAYRTAYELNPMHYKRISLKKEGNSRNIVAIYSASTAPQTTSCMLRP